MRGMALEALRLAIGEAHAAARSGRGAFVHERADAFEVNDRPPPACEVCLEVDAAGFVFARTARSRCEPALGTVDEVCA